MDENAFGYNPVLPRNIRAIFMWLCQEVASLHSKWQFYLGLYAGEEDRRLLSELASGSFGIIEESLRLDMTMSICRLSDPPGTEPKLNLSVKALARKCQEVDGLTDLVDDFAQACKPVRKHRNKLLAHRDVNTTINPQDNPLEPIGRTQIDTILDLAGRILNVVYRHFTNLELTFAPSLIGGADTLVHWLGVAKESKDAGIAHGADRSI